MDRTLAAVIGGIQIFIEVLSWVIFADIIMSWIAPDIPLKEFTRRLTEPLVSAFRPISDKITRGSLPIDLSPALTLITLYIISAILGSIV